MNRLFILLLLSFLWACQSKEELKNEKQFIQDQEYIESFYSLMENKKYLILRYLAQIQEKHAAINSGTQTLSALQKIYKLNQKESDFIQLDSLFEIGYNVCQKEQIELAPFRTKKNLSNYLAISTSHHSAKDSLLTKLRLLNLSYSLIESIHKKLGLSISYSETYAPNQHFELLTTLNQSRFKIGDTVKLDMQFYANVLDVNDSFYSLQQFSMKGKTVQSDTFSIIATCEGKEPCIKEINYEVISPTGSGHIRQSKKTYTVYPTQP